MDFSALHTPLDLRGPHIIEAARSSESMSALLERFREIAVPGKGTPIILAALARLGTNACEWIDGELRIEISGDERSSKIQVSTSIGGGFREKLFPDTTLNVPLKEFSRSIARAPKLVRPLTMKETDKRIVLTVSSEVRKTTMPPPMIKIDQRSLMDMPNLAAPKNIPILSDGEELGLPPTAIIQPRASKSADGKSSPPRSTKSAPPKSVGRRSAPPPSEKKVVLRRRVRDDSK